MSCYDEGQDFTIECKKYLGPCRTFLMEVLAEIVNSLAIT